MDDFSRMGATLRAFLEVFQKSHRTKEHFGEMRKKGEEVLFWAKKLGVPHLESEVHQFLKQLEQFFSYPENQEIAQEVAKSALRLEQETREI